MEKYWLASYPPELTEEVPNIPYQSLQELFQASFDDFAERDAFECIGARLTYAQVDKLSDRLAGYLQAQGMVKGDRLAIMMPNLLQYPVAVVAAFKAGLVVVNVNPLYTPDELKHQLTDSGAKGLIVLDTFAHTVQQVESDIPTELIITTQLAECVVGVKKHLINFVYAKVKKQVKPYSLNNELKWKDVLAEDRAFETVPLALDDIAFLQYTGGTTGVAKGVMLSHSNLLNNLFQATQFLHMAGLERGKIGTIISPLPIYHIFCLTANLNEGMLMGAMNVLIPNPRDMKAFLKVLTKHQFVYITGVNTLYNGMLNDPLIDKVDFSALKISLGGGMTVQMDTARRWKEKTGVVLLEAYGLTESSPAVCINLATNTEYNGSIGVPIAGTEISIRDPEGNELGLEEEGELWVRGPQVMVGYWERPDSTAKTLTEEGWLKTGDVAKVDERGYVYIVDRIKNMIIVSGFNVYANEIENVATTHEGIFEAACIGVPDEKSGEAVKVFVVRAPGAKIDEQGVIDHCREHLTGYKVPDHVEFRDELPKTAVGKISHKDLRD